MSLERLHPAPAAMNATSEIPKSDRFIVQAPPSNSTQFAVSSGVFTGSVAYIRLLRKIERPAKADREVAQIGDRGIHEDFSDSYNDMTKVVITVSSLRSHFK